MGVVVILGGAFFGWLGFNYLKGADSAAKANPQYSSDIYKLTGGFLIFVAAVIIGLGVFLIVIDSQMPKSTSSPSSGHKCAICGKSGGRQITNQAGDNNYYCTEHYADAWQYYYGD